MHLSFLRRLRFRIPLLIVFSALVMIGGSYFVSAKFVKKDTIASVELDLRNRLYFFQNAFKMAMHNGDAEQAQSLISSMMSDPDLLVFLYANAEGVVKVSNSVSARGEEVFARYSDIERDLVSVSVESRQITTRLDTVNQYLHGVAPVCVKSMSQGKDRCGFIYYKVDTQYHIDKAKELLSLEALIISAGMFLVAFVLVFFLHFWITRRFNILSDALNLFAAGNHATRVSMAGNDEFNHLSMHVNDLFSRLEQDEFELKNRQKELDAVFNTVVDGIVIIDANGIIHDCNPAVTQLMGYEKDEMLGKNVSMLMPAPYAQEHDQYLQNYMSTHVSKIIGKGREVEAQRKGGDVFPIELAVSEMLLDGNSMFAGVIRDVSEQKNLQAALVKANELLFRSNLQLKNTAKTDGLTGLANRRHFDHVLSEELNRAVRHKSDLSLLICDVDFFKRFNDSYGHQVGDDCLREIGSLLISSFKRSGELPARYGGEEFAVIIPGIDADAVRRIAEEFCHAVYKRNIPHNDSLVADRVTMSIGVVSMVEGGAVDIRTFIKWADMALYRAKAQGRNQTVVFCPDKSADVVIGD